MVDVTEVAFNLQAELLAAKSELAALRGELADARATIELKQRDLIEAQTAVTGWAAKCKAAEQRNADQLKLIAGLVEYADKLLGDVNDAWSYAGSTGNPETHKDDDYATAVALIAKPTESGASE